MDESLEREAYEEINGRTAPDGQHPWDPNCHCPACEEENEEMDWARDHYYF